MVLRENKNIAYAKFGGTNKEYDVKLLLEILTLLTATVVLENDEWRIYFGCCSS